MPSDALQRQAQVFADRLTSTVRSVVGSQCPGFRARALHGLDRDVFTVRQEPNTGVPLLVDGQPLLTLTVSYECVWDGTGEYLAVNESRVAVFSGPKASGEPLFRYEFDRVVTGDKPGAHFHIHSHRDALTFVMTKCGSSTRRARRLAQSVHRASAVPRQSDLHFPLGGSRFRPCLEDVLEMLVLELGVDCETGWREALAAGREEWRRSQVGTVVRDAPEEAVRVLTALGYEVKLKLGNEPAPGKSHHLRDL